MLRPLVSESYDSATTPITEALSGVSDPSPLRTLIFDALILLGMLGWLIGRIVGASRSYRKTGLEWGAVLVAVGAVLSCLYAGNQRLAINGSIDWLCYPLLTISLVQLLRAPWQRHLLVSVVLATACVQMFQCAEQYLGGFEDTIAHYESTKEAFWSRQGVELDSKKVEAFERRMRAREATGFLPHSNVTGSYFLLCGFAFFGLAVAVWKRAKDVNDGAAALGLTVLALVMACGIWMTGSRGAMISAAAGIAFWVVLRWRRDWLRANRGKAFWLGWAAIGSGVIAVVGHGLYHDELPGASLTFRWQYWTASTEMIADHPLTGVGRENFGRHYLRYKPIESPEEVANPHNLLVQAAAEWGVFGLAGFLLMLWGVSRVFCFECRSCDTREPETETSANRLWPWTLPLVLVVVFVRLPLLGSGGASFLYYAGMTTGICWLAGFALLGCGAKAVHRTHIVDLSTFRTGVCLGVLAFLLHETINFALFVPGTATTFFALLACCLPHRGSAEPMSESPNPLERWGLVAGVLVGLGVVMFLGIVPVARSANNLATARRSMGGYVTSPISQVPTSKAFQQVIDADPFDPTPCLEYARWLAGLSAVPQVRDEALALALDALALALRRDPHSLKLRRLHMQLLMERADAMKSGELYDEAIAVGRASLELYPQDPEGIIAVAEITLRAGTATGRQDWLRAAIADYDRALALNEQRPDSEELHRLREKDVREALSKISDARRYLEEN